VKKKVSDPDKGWDQKIKNKEKSGREGEREKKSSAGPCPYFLSAFEISTVHYCRSRFEEERQT
jgi:hypothetical protein